MLAKETHLVLSPQAVKTIGTPPFTKNKPESAFYWGLSKYPLREWNQHEFILLWICLTLGQIRCQSSDHVFKNCHKMILECFFYWEIKFSIGSPVYNAWNLSSLKNDKWTKQRNKKSYASLKRIEKMRFRPSGSELMAFCWYVKWCQFTQIIPLVWLYELGNCRLFWITFSPHIFSITKKKYFFFKMIFIGV